MTLLAYFSGLLLTCPVQMDWVALVHITDPLAHKTGMTMAFFTLSMAEIFHSFNMRSRRASLFSMGQNGYLWGAMVLSLVLSTVVLYVPALAAAFDFVPLSGTAYGVSMALALAVIPVVELVKAVQRPPIVKSAKKVRQARKFARRLFHFNTSFSCGFML